jgi:hypothetical protein
MKSLAESPNLMETADHYGTSVVMADTGKLQFLKGNPFLYNPATAPYQISSLEDYIISAKKEDIAFGDVIRNPRFSPRTRKKILKKAFKTWNKDYSEKKSVAFTESDKLIDVIGEVKYLQYSWKMKLISIVLFFVMLFIIGTDSYLWERLKMGSFGYFLSQALIQMFETSYFLKAIANITIYVILILIFYLTAYGYISKDFRRNYQLSQEYLKESEKKISFEYRRKFRKARRYYLSLINRKKQPYFAPLSIEEIEEGEVNITTFNTICKVTVDRAYRFKKQKPYIIFVKNILLLASIVGSLVVFAFSVYHILLNIF